MKVPIDRDFWSQKWQFWKPFFAVKKKTKILFEKKWRVLFFFMWWWWEYFIELLKIYK